jgi:acyl carrier protein
MTTGCGAGALLGWSLGHLLFDGERMNTEFQEGLAEILEVEVEDIQSDLALAEGSWDSLAVVSTIALIDDVYDIQVHPNGIAECKTVGDLEKLVTAELASAGKEA